MPFFPWHSSNRCPCSTMGHPQVFEICIGMCRLRLDRQCRPLLPRLDPGGDTFDLLGGHHAQRHPGALLVGLDAAGSSHRNSPRQSIHFDAVER